MPFTITHDHDVAALPDGTLITWQPVPDDPSSAAVAFVRHHRDDAGHRVTWISPGNGWEPESLDVLTYPVVVCGGNGTDQPEWIGGEVTELPELPFTITGGTYPRDVALQAACTLLAGENLHKNSNTGQLDLSNVVSTAAQLADWLIKNALGQAISDLDASSVMWPGHFVGGPTDG
jgi:hypothetical protein